MCWMQSLKGNSLISLNCNATMDWCCGTAIDGCWYVVGQWVKHHPRGNVVLARPEDFTAWLWNVETAACMTVLSGHGGWVTCGDFTPDGTFFFPSNKQKEKEWFMIWQPIASMCHLTLKTPASFLEVDAFELDLEPPPRCAHLQGGCEPTCSDCQLKLSLKH
jgi:WD40 repeat protein